MNTELVSQILQTHQFTEIYPEVRDYLSDLCTDPIRHGKYLNTLSYIEHLGSRYLMLTHKRNTLSEPVLKHFYEEVRHSYALRRMGERLVRRPLTYDAGDLLLGPSASMYFARLAAFVRMRCRELTDNVVLPYLYVSATVEIRALWLYTLHESLLKQAGLSLSFAGILSEEDRHVEYIFEDLVELDPRAESNLREIVNEECKYFRHFFSQLMAQPTCRHSDSTAVLPA